MEYFYRKKIRLLGKQSNRNDVNDKAKDFKEMHLRFYSGTLK